MRTKRLLAAAGISAALAVGGMAGFVLGVPGVSGAQTGDAPTTTQPPDPESPSTEAPAPRERGENCPKDAEGSGTSGTSGTPAARNARFQRL